MWEWLQRHWLPSVALELVVVVACLAVVCLLAIAAGYGALWGVRIWLGRKEFVSRNIPESRSIKVAGAEVKFAGSLRDALASVTDDVKVLRFAVAKLYEKRKEMPDGGSK